MASNAGEKKRDLLPGADFIKELYGIWVAERPAQLAAALAYFGLFSFAPVIYIAFSIAGIFLDQAELMNRFMIRLESMLGPGLAQAVQDLLNNLVTKTPSGSLLISLISFGSLLLAASGVFFQIQFALNTVWKVPNPARGALQRTLLQRLFSFLMVIALGLLLVVAAVIGFLMNWLTSVFRLADYLPPLTAVGFIGFAALTFAVMYKLLPAIKIAWRDVWLGAVVAASLVTLGGWLISFFIKNTSISSALEAAGSFVVLLTGFYYFAQIFLLGAILTRLYAQRYGSMRPQPAPPEPEKLLENSTGSPT
jgi:membrane protein